MTAIDEICAKVKRGEKLNQDEREILIESILDDIMVILHGENETE